MNEQFEHIKFMDTYNLTIDDLPAHIKLQVSGFNIYDAALDDISIENEKEGEKVGALLKRVDTEILLELEEEFDDLLLENGVRTHKKEKLENTSVSDEMLLEQLFKMGRTRNIGRSDLRAMGMEAKINGNTIVGAYFLKKESTFYHRYQIILLDEKI
ncbi:hypothetical protein [uncultured Aquimarina sp.]|uniref:hypothetical protein n=1 Tax=uncultured Aquimarina sp. TaxID=575652 RepID=UPI00262E78A1|nr:hypothetical protein [uncultured Aquimarina sp.]